MQKKLRDLGSILVFLQEDTLEEGTATCSTILAWRILWTEEPGRLESISLRRVGHNWSDLAWTQTLFGWGNPICKWNQCLNTYTEWLEILKVCLPPNLSSTMLPQCYTFPSLAWYSQGEMRRNSLQVWLQKSIGKTFVCYWNRRSFCSLLWSIFTGQFMNWPLWHQGIHWEVLALRG